MKVIEKALWIQDPVHMDDVCPVFKKTWTCDKKIDHAVLRMSALGVYEAYLNGKRVSDYVLAPGWTVYEKRLQVQEYDITELLENENELFVTVGKGWFSSPMPGWMESEDKIRRKARPRALLAEVCIEAENDTTIIGTDESWLCGESAVRFSEIYDGEVYDASFETKDWKNASLLDWPMDILIPQEGEEIREIESVNAKELLHTPNGEIVVDFGQEVTGYVEFTIDGKAGQTFTISHGEVLDQNGNFYNANYRSAKAKVMYICKEGMQTWHPRLTFFGFRYIKIEGFGEDVSIEQFRAIVVHSDMKKTGSLECGVPSVNQLFSNIFWGQKGNFLDVPTDCPQRDERLGWTGDAQVFVKTASYNYDVEKFFQKWMRDLKADQRENGAIGQVIPDYLPEEKPSAAWGDVATIVPWQIYLTYGNIEVLAEQFESMKAWVNYITQTTSTQYLWTGGIHFGDWLGLDAPVGSYKGSTREDFIASAFYAHSTELVIKAGKLLNEDISAYEVLYKNIVSEFQKTFPEYTTQTEHVLAIQFGLAKDKQKTADALALMIQNDGTQMRTGFVGTPYILHVLSEYGYTELAYSLFLRRKYPSWLYSVEKGATTIWEHWDGIMENGEFWSTDMNSYNHYAYGSVADWVYEKAAGIQPLESAPGFSQVRIAPQPDERMGWLKASINTRNGKISSMWKYDNGRVRYEIETAVPAEIVIGEKHCSVKAGNYIFWS